MTAPLTVAVAHALDALTFLLAAVLLGLAGEANPIARDLGIGGALLLKGLGVVALVALLFVLSARVPRWTSRVAAGLAVVGLVGVGANLGVLV
jgi:hypothetical protein